MREVQALVSPSSKKRRAEDTAKHISKKKKKTKKIHLVIPTECSEEEAILETPITSKPLSLEKTIVVTPEVSVSNSFHEEAPTLDIIEHVSDTDANVNMGEGALNLDTPKSTQGTQAILSVENVSSTLVSLSPYIIPTTSTTDSPTFENIINHLFTTIFSS